MAKNPGKLSGWMTRAGGGAAVVLALAGCTCSPADTPGGTVPDRCQASPPLLSAQKTDILFVVDNSNSMREEQEAVALELPAFLSKLQEGSGLEQDFQVGVITTSVYQHILVDEGTGQTDYREYPQQSGSLRPVPPDPGGLFPGGERVLTGEDPLFVEKFSLLVQQGTSGSGQETAFEAAYLAVTERLADPVESGGTGAFLRDGARLLVVVAGDEDDCSERDWSGTRSPENPPQVAVGFASDRDWCRDQRALLTPVEDYYQLFQSLTDGAGARREVVWASIAPVARTDKRAEQALVDGVLRNADCATSFQAGFRMRRMAELFDPALDNLESICADSYQDSLVRIAELANTASSVEVGNVPDPQLLKVEVTRADGTVQACTVANGGIRYTPSAEGRSARIEFLGSCARKADDLEIEVKLLCIG